MEWTYKDLKFTTEMIDSYIGFVYMITNLTNNKKYIGKKQFQFKKVKQVKKKRKSIKVDSDWESYFGSSDELKKDVELLGKENFKREILILCKSKSILSYWESKYIFTLGCLESNDYYNSWVSVRCNKNNLRKEFGI